MSRTRSLAALGVAGVMTLTGCIFDDVKTLKQEVEQLKVERAQLEKYLKPGLGPDVSLADWLKSLGNIVCRMKAKPSVGAGIEDPNNMCPPEGPGDVKSVPTYPPR